MPQYPFITYENPFLPVSQAIDTVYVADTLPCDSVVPSFITSGLGRPITPLPRVTYEVMSGWNLVLLGFVLLLIVLNKQLYPRQFRQALEVPKGVAHTNQLLREWNPTRSFLGESFFVADILVMALFAQKSFVVLSRDVLQYNSLRMFGIICSCVTSWVGLRYGLLYFINWIFDTKEAVSRQMAVQLSVSSLSLIIMLPLLLVLLYNPYSMFVWMGFGIMALVAVLRFVLEIIETRISTKMPSFYIFSYFCALEIAPIAILLTAVYRYYFNGTVF